MQNFILFTFLFFFVSCSSNKVCRNPEGNEVDWYAIFFMPASVSSDGKIHYGYFDPNINIIKYYAYSENNFPPTQITSYAKGTSNDFNYFFWNDDKTIKNGEPASASSTKAHAKGSLIYDKDNGVFLLHSLPRFPTRNANNEILTELPSNGGSYGQTFLCITFDKKNSEQIAKLLNCINVSVNKVVNSDKVNSTPNTWVNGLINNKMDSSCSMQHTVKIKSKRGETFTFFGKNYKNKIIPYDTTLRQALNDDIFVRTWSRPALAPSLNDNYKLMNVLEVEFGSYVYYITKEHSKWAIARNKNVVCFSDLNHTESQKERGGHIVCFENAKLHSLMKAAIVTTDETKTRLLSDNPLVEKLKRKINESI